MLYNIYNPIIYNNIIWIILYYNISIIIRNNVTPNPLQTDSQTTNYVKRKKSQTDVTETTKKEENDSLCFISRLKF